MAEAKVDNLSPEVKEQVNNAISACIQNEFQNMKDQQSGGSRLDPFNELKQTAKAFQLAAEEATKGTKERCTEGVHDNLSNGRDLKFDIHPKGAQNADTNTTPAKQEETAASRVSNWLKSFSFGSKSEQPAAQGQAPKEKNWMESAIERAMENTYNKPSPSPTNPESYGELKPSLPPTATNQEPKAEATQR